MSAFKDVVVVPEPDIGRTMPGICFCCTPERTVVVIPDEVTVMATTPNEAGRLHHCSMMPSYSLCSVEAPNAAS